METKLQSKSSTTDTSSSKADDWNKLSETIITFLAVGFIGFLIGTVKNSWEKSRRGKKSTESKWGSGASSCESSNNNTGTLGSMMSLSTTSELLTGKAPRV